MASLIPAMALLVPRLSGRIRRLRQRSPCNVGQRRRPGCYGMFGPAGGRRAMARTAVPPLATWDGGQRGTVGNVGRWATWDGGGAQGRRLRSGVAGSTGGFGAVAKGQPNAASDIDPWNVRRGAAWVGRCGASPRGTAFGIHRIWNLVDGFFGPAATDRDRIGGRDRDRHSIEPPTRHEDAKTPGGRQVMLRFSWRLGVLAVLGGSLCAAATNRAPLRLPRRPGAARPAGRPRLWTTWTSLRQRTTRQVRCNGGGPVFNVATGPDSEVA
jgi:hypothetical protein